MLCIRSNLLTRKLSTAALVTPAATAAPAFSFQWKGLDKPKTFTSPQYLSTPTPKLYKQPTLVVAPKPAKYSYDLNEFIALSRQVRKCQSASELEELIKVTPHRIFNAFSIAEVFLKFHTFQPEARAAGTKKEEQHESESKFVRPSVVATQHMFLPAMDLEMTPKAFAALTSAFVKTHTPIPPFVLFKLRWAKGGAFEAKELAKTMYNVAVNMPRKETYEPMLSEMKSFEQEIFSKAVNVLTKKLDAGVLKYEYQNRALGEMAFALDAYYGEDKEQPQEVAKLFSHFRDVVSNRSLSNIPTDVLVNLIAAPLLRGNKDEQLVQAIEAQVTKRGVAAFALPELVQLGNLLQGNEQLSMLIQTQVDKQQPHKEELTA